MEYMQIEKNIALGNLNVAFTNLLFLLAKRHKKLDLKRYQSLLSMFEKTSCDNGRNDYVSYSRILSLGIGESLRRLHRRKLPSEFVKKIQEWANSPGVLQEFSDAIARAKVHEDIYHKEAEVGDWPYGASVLLAGQGGSEEDYQI